MRSGVSECGHRQTVCKGLGPPQPALEVSEDDRLSAMLPPTDPGRNQPTLLQVTMSLGVRSERR